MTTYFDSGDGVRPWRTAFTKSQRIRVLPASYAPATTRRHDQSANRRMTNLADMTIVSNMLTQIHRWRPGLLDVERRFTVANCLTWAADSRPERRHG
jgi:hypothetical protein